VQFLANTITEQQQTPPVEQYDNVDPEVVQVEQPTEEGLK
jgi:hypothetical protein